MGSRHPDRIRSPPNPVEVLTLGEMHQAQWTVRATCRRCGLDIRVNLASMIRAYGPDAIWWGRKTPCPGWSCEAGELVYSACSIAGGTWRTLDTLPPQRTIDIWKEKRRPYRGPR
jgi:hypothetical protein